VSTYTGPADSPASINDGNDIKQSTDAVIKDLKARDIISKYDAVLVACYSVHPLVDAITRDFASARQSVTGIFEASILTALSILPSNTTSALRARQWGIVTTGKYWEEHLASGVASFLGGTDAKSNLKFAGVQSSGLDAGDFHSVDPAEVARKLKEAAVRLFQSGDVDCVAMGCAGMAGLEQIIRAAAVDTYGEERGNQVAIVDAVKAGILQLDLTVKSKRLFLT